MRVFKLAIMGCALGSLFGATISNALAHSMLYAPSEDDDPVFRAALSAFLGGPVDYFDARGATPTVAQMAAYDCVHTWVNSPYANNIAMGDNLADYVDGGGRAILGVFSTFTGGNFLAGRIMDPGYSPVDSPAGTNHYSFSSYAGDGSARFHNGVVSYGGTYRDFLVVQGNGVVDAHYLDGEIAVAYRPDLGVIYVNGSGPVQLAPVGDWARLIANTCVAAVPEPSALLLALFGLVAIAVRRPARGEVC